jgi:hypothetical protein
MKPDQFTPDSTGPTDSPRADLNDSSVTVKKPTNLSNEADNCSVLPVNTDAPDLISEYTSANPGCPAIVGSKNGSASNRLANSEAARALPRIDSSALSNISSSFMPAVYEFRDGVNTFSNHVQSITLEPVEVPA